MNLGMMVMQSDRRFFGTLLKNLFINDSVIVVSGDHSTPCQRKGHSDDPVPLLISGNNVLKDNSTRFTEHCASRGSLGLLMGVDVLNRAINIVSR
jgi:2,3-bisphosphoglycerate-independent phosphoglycerate mutase